MGCGRSGTTIMGFLLGNGENSLDLGEVMDFLKRRGEPNEFGPETANGIFWKAVKTGVLQERMEIFNEKTITRLSKMEDHAAFLPIYAGLLPKRLIQEYAEYANSLYRNIIKNAENTEFFIDSSKYPGKALLLSMLLENLDLYVLHIVRNPIGVVGSLTQKRPLKRSKSFWEANLYYFTINLYCFLIKLRLHKKQYLKVRYEKILEEPETTLKKISNHTGIQLDPVLEKIEKKQPLNHGFIFNGNRMRVKKEVRLERPKRNYDRTFKNSATIAINGFWY